MKDDSSFDSPAWLFDLQNEANIRLPCWEKPVNSVSDKGVFSVGLTIQDSVVCEPEGKQNQLVILLFSLLRKEDGFWLNPNPDLPCLVNDDDVKNTVLLSKGSTIKAGDRFIRFHQRGTSLKRLSVPGLSANREPPPKPKRSNHKQVSLKQPKEEDDEETDRSLLQSFCVVTHATLDEELLSQLSTSDQIANLAASYLSRQLLHHTDIVLSTVDMDKIYRVMQEIAVDQEDMLLEFAVDYKRSIQASQQPVTLPLTSSVALHGPVIHLLTNLLKASLDPVEHNVLWLRLLYTFSHYTPNVEVFLCYQTAGVVMGTMAAHSAHSEVQHYGCLILGQLSTYRPMVGQKGPVRESGVELIVKAMKTHSQDLSVLRPACRALANLTTVTTSTLQDIINGEVTKEPEHTERNLGILEFLHTHAVEVVMETLRSYSDDVTLYCECRRILNFFKGDISGKENKRSISQRISFNGSKLEPEKSEHDTLTQSVMMPQGGATVTKNQTTNCEYVEPTGVNESDPEHSIASNDTHEPFLFTDDVVLNQTICDEKINNKQEETPEVDTSVYISDHDPAKKSHIRHSVDFSRNSVTDQKQAEKQLTEKDYVGDETGRLTMLEKVDMFDDEPSPCDNYGSGEKKDLARSVTIVTEHDCIRRITSKSNCAAPEETNSSFHDRLSKKSLDQSEKIDLELNVESTAKTELSVVTSCDKTSNSSPKVKLQGNKGDHKLLDRDHECVEELIVDTSDDSFGHRHFSPEKVNINRKQWGSVYSPEGNDILTTSQQSLSLQDSMDYAVMRSCDMNSSIVSDFCPETEEEIRMNRMMWKSVVKELKLKQSFTPDDSKEFVQIVDDVHNGSGVSVTNHVEKIQTLTTNEQGHNTLVVHSAAFSRDVNDGSEVEEKKGESTVTEDEDVPEGEVNILADLLLDSNSVQKHLETRSKLLQYLCNACYDEGRIQCIETLKVPLPSAMIQAGVPKETAQYMKKLYPGYITLADADPALALNVLETLSDSIEGQLDGTKLLRHLSELLNPQHFPGHIELASWCIRSILEGALAPSINEGWGYFTLKSLHKITGSLLQSKDLDPDDSCREQVSLLHMLLEKLIVHKN